MGCSIKFVRLDDFIADVDVLDLSTNGYSLQNDGYFQVAAPIGAKSVREVITLKLQGTSKDDLAAMTQEIDEKIKQVQWWMDDPGVEKYQVWIRVQLDGETYPRQAQILSITPPDKVKVFTPMEIGANYLGEYQIGIERTPFWEEASYTDVSKSSIGDIGGLSSQSAIVGDVPARLVRFRIGPHASSTNITTAWIGFKTSRFGITSNFVSVWGLNNGFYDPDTTAVSDATAYTGYRLVTTFASVATLALRTRAAASTASPTHIPDQRGTYLVLLRAKMSDTSIARARINYSFNTIRDGVLTLPIYRSRQIISGTTWHLYEMGVVKNPPSRIYQYMTATDFYIHLDAERISGAGELHTDCLIMIPIDDGAIKITSPLPMSASVDFKAAAYQAANGDIWGLVESSGTSAYYSALVAPQNGWGLPNDTAPYIVCAVDDNAAGSVNGGTLDFNYSYIKRWRTLRGNAV